MADRFRKPLQPNKMSRESNGRDSLGPLRPIGSFFREHPAIVGTLLYLQVTTVGVVYSWQLYRRFDINVFDYAEANDFLLAAFKNPVVFAMSIATLLILFALVAMNVVQKRSAGSATFSTTPSRFYRYFRIIRVVYIWGVSIAAIPYSLLIPYLFANSAADALQSPLNKEPLTRVQYRATAGSNEQTTETGLRVIGTTQNFVFFYHRKKSHTLIIPSAQIVEMKQRVTKDSLQTRKLLR